jgi:hypothetical protein
LAYTVGGAIAAAINVQATVPANKAAYIQASVTITDAAPGMITGKGPLFRTALLGNMSWVWDSGYKFLMQRGGTAPQFLLGLNIEPVIAILGPLVIRRPAFANPVLRRAFFRKRYQGDFALYLQPHFNVVLNENSIIPSLTGTIHPLALTPGPIVPPGTIEIVLESVAITDVFK